MSLNERYQLFKLFLIVTLSAIFDVLGVASLMPFLMVLSSPETISSNIFISNFFSYFGINNSKEVILLLGLVIFILFSVSIVLRGYVSWAILRFTNMESHRLSIRLFENYMYKPYEWFLKTHSGDLSKKVLNEVAQIVNGILIPLVNIATHFVILIALLIFLVVIEPKIAITSMIIIGSIYLIFYLYIKDYLVNLGKKRLLENKIRHQTITESFNGFKDIKARDAEYIYINKLKLSSYVYFKTQIIYQLISQLPRYLLEAIIFGGILFLIFVLLPENGKLSDILPVIGTYILAGYRIMPSIQSLYSNFSNFKYSSSIFDSLYKNLELNNHSHIQNNQRINFKKSIKLQNVSYSYENSNNYSLSNLSIEIFAGNCVGLVGLSGTGKTTTLDIILGLLVPNSGELLVDDHQITPENVKSWRSNIGYVSQNPFIAFDSIACNIAFGIDYNDINWDALINASIAVNLHDFIMKELPNGYDTILGEKGIRLSGGQRQKVAIARALYYSPKLLVLDEATSALDNINESIVINNIRNINNEMTCLIVAHRLNSVKNCDYILFLKQNNLYATGSYDELLNTCPDFFKLTISNK